MTDVTLTIPISYQSHPVHKFRLISTQFGDGYSQDAGDGINSTVDEWTITVPNLTTDQADDLVALLKSAANTRLAWTPPTPGATAQRWRCPESVQRTFHTYDVESISFVLRQAF